LVHIQQLAATSDHESVVQKREKLTGKENYGTWKTSTEMALMRLKAWKVITDDAPVTPDSYDDDPEALSVACKEWLLETHGDHEVTAQKVTANRKKFKKRLSNEHEQWREPNIITQTRSITAVPAPYNS
jgi:hypothetical protein